MLRPRSLSLTSALAAALIAGPLSGQTGLVRAGTDRDSGPARLSDHVVLISIDGLRPDFYLDESWPAPVMQRMAREGAHARGVRGVFPSVTYPSHTTMVTGARPAVHGVVNNTPFNPRGQTGAWYWEFEHVRTETLWEAVSRSGGTTASVWWPVTVGAPIDYNVPEVWSLSSDTTRYQAVERHTRPEGYLDLLQREASGRIEVRGPGGAPIDRWPTTWWDEKKTDIAAWILETEQPNLLTLHIVTPDGAQHTHGREHPEVREAVALADRLVARLTETAERAGMLDRTTFIVTGDHGFIDLDVQLSPNSWLVEAGLMEEERDRGDWRAAFHGGGSAVMLYTRDPEDTETVERVKEIVRSQPDRIRRLFMELDEAALRELGADPNSRYALSGVLGSYVSGAIGRPAISAPTTEGQHGFHPDIHPDIYTGFVAWGAGIRPESQAALMDLTDVAPLIAELLDLDFEAPDGVLRGGLLLDRWW